MLCSSVNVTLLLFASIVIVARRTSTKKTSFSIDSDTAPAPLPSRNIIWYFKAYYVLHESKNFNFPSRNLSSACPPNVMLRWRCSGLRAFLFAPSLFSKYFSLTTQDLKKEPPDSTYSEHHIALSFSNLPNIAVKSIVHMKKWYFVRPFWVGKTGKAVKPLFSRVRGGKWVLRGHIYPRGEAEGVNQPRKTPFPPENPVKIGDSRFFRFF